MMHQAGVEPTQVLRGAKGDVRGIFPFLHRPVIGHRMGQQLRQPRLAFLCPTVQERRPGRCQLLVQQPLRSSPILHPGEAIILLGVAQAGLDQLPG